MNGILLRGLFLALPILTAGVVTASPAGLNREIDRFSTSTGAKGLTFCALFSPVAPDRGSMETAVPNSRDSTRTGPGSSARTGPGSTARTGPDTSTRAGPDSSASVRFGAHLPLIPASLAKLATTALALDRLGSGFTFKTELRTTGVIKADVLTGDLVIRSGGDPFLVSERLWLLAHQVRMTGIRRILGRLILDASFAAPSEDDPARARDREVGDRAYAARLSALPVNFNAAAFRVAPGDRVGAPASVTPDPLPCGYLRIRNDLTTCRKDSSAAWSLKLTPDSLGERVLVSGRIPLGNDPTFLYRSVADPEHFAVSLFRAFLEDSGVVVDGPAVIVNGPAETTETRPLLEFPSLPLGTLLANMNHFSNNLMADQIAMQLADTTLGLRMAPKSRSESDKLGQANLTAGSAVLTRWLQAELSAEPTVHLGDGSGLNPADRLTGGVILTLLVRSWRDLRIQPDFVASLPQPGEDGTLKRRFSDGFPPGLRAKTGTMADPMVSGIAGYLQHPRLGPIAFVILMNVANASGDWSIQKMQDLQERWIDEYCDGSDLAPGALSR